MNLIDDVNSVGLRGLMRQAYIMHRFTIIVAKDLLKVKHFRILKKSDFFWGSNS